MQGILNWHARPRMFIVVKSDMLLPLSYQVFVVARNCWLIFFAISRVLRRSNTTPSPIGRIGPDLELLMLTLWLNFRVYTSTIAWKRSVMSAPKKSCNTPRLDWRSTDWKRLGSTNVRKDYRQNESFGSTGTESEQRDTAGRERGEEKQPTSTPLSGERCVR
jgi:hypothetical protein